MTREKAVEILKDENEKQGHFKSYSMYSVALEMAIKALEQEPCEDAISRERTMLRVREFIENQTYTEKMLVDDLNALPPVTPQPKTGHWIKEETIYGWDDRSYQCSICGRSIHLDTAFEDLTDYPYCHCGAKMNEEEE